METLGNLTDFATYADWMATYTAHASPGALLRSYSYTGIYDISDVRTA
jgi:hypothetical protein